MSIDKSSLAEVLKRSSELIDKDQTDEAYKVLSSMVEEHPDWVDERLNAEMFILMKQMEYKAALRDFSFLRELALVFKYCEKEYKKTGICANYNDEDSILDEYDTIWWCWLQGLDNAPDVVKCCYESVKKLGRQIIVLSDKNLHEYVRMPESIEKKYHSGIISKTHYSDLVRLELITTKGGSWIDATTWISGTDQIVPLMENEDLFMFRSGNVSDYILFDSWFIHSRKRSRILESTKNMLFDYWEKEDKLINYFLMHIMMTLACQLFREEYNKIPLFSNEPAHVLQHDLFAKYSDKRWDQIIRMSDVHKLTYKYDDGEYEGSFLYHLLKRD